jgi:hypothetical protein
MDYSVRAVLVSLHVRCSIATANGDQDWGTPLRVETRIGQLAEKAAVTLAKLGYDVELCHLPRWKRQECNAFDE